MKSQHSLAVRLFSLLTLCSLLIQIAACGTLLYPERRGQKTGQIDAGVAILDAVGLVFFIVPGLIALAVDFATGAIYLPAGGTKGSGMPLEKTAVIYANPADLRNEAYLKSILESAVPDAGTIDLRSARYQVVSRGTDINQSIRRLAQNGFNERESAALRF